VRLLILALRCVAPAAALVTGRNVLGVVRGTLAGKGALRRLLVQAASLWMLSETLFWVYMESCRRYLNSQTNRRWQAVSTHSTPEKKRRSLERWLLSLVQVCKQDVGGSRPAGGSAPSLQDAVRRASSARSLAAPLQRGRSSAANLLGLGGIGREQSVNDMLKVWGDNGDITDADLQLAKWTNIAGFFYGAGKGEVCDIATWLWRGNLEDWVSHYWFRGADAEELKQRSPNESAELTTLVDLVIANMGFVLREGRNGRVQARRVWSDPIPTRHRPMLVYVGTSLLCPLMTTQFMSIIGFRKERIGGLTYWHRLPCSGMDPAVDIAGAMQTPLVVVHGLGVGLVPYYLFVLRLARNHSGDIFVPDLPFLATAPWLSVPSPREVVAQLTDMLRAHGHTAAHFTGHSFGAVVVGWVLKMSPSSVVCVTLLDPACFLVMSAECCVKICCGPVNSAVEILVRYFCFQELFTQNLLTRNNFWEQNQIWPEDLHVPSVIEFAADDHIVPSLYIRRLLDHERRERKQRSQRRPPRSNSSALLDGSGNKQPSSEPMDIQWCEGFMHGEILLRPRSQDKLFAKMRGMAHSMYAKMDGRA